MLRCIVCLLALATSLTSINRAFSQQPLAFDFSPAINPPKVGDAILVEAADDLAIKCGKLLQTPPAEGSFMVQLQGRITSIDASKGVIRIEALQEYPYFGSDRKNRTETRILQLTTSVSLKDVRTPTGAVALVSDSGPLVPDLQSTLPVARISSTKGTKVRAWAVVEEIKAD